MERNAIKIRTVIVMTGTVCWLIGGAEEIECMGKDRDADRKSCDDTVAVRYFIDDKDENEENDDDEIIN